MITAPPRTMLEILQMAFGNGAETNITTDIQESKVVVTVGGDAPMTFDRCLWEEDPWMKSITDLGGNRPKVALERDPMADALNEKERVKSILDWLDQHGGRRTEVARQTC